MSSEAEEALGLTVARLARQIERSLTDIDLTLSQYRLLALLGGGQVPASELAAKLAVSPPSVTVVVDGLVARGLVERHHVVGDRRQVSHELTAAGRRTLTQANRAADRTLAEIATHLADDERMAQATDGLRAWSDALHAKRVAHRRERPA